MAHLNGKSIDIERGQFAGPDSDPVLEVAAGSPADFRRVLGMFATGVTVVTTGGEQPHGMTANAFTSVSLKPPLVLVCVAREARMHSSILGTGTFAVSVLTAGQESLARHFSDRTRPSGAAQFRAGEWVSGVETGAPVLAGCAAWLECGLSAVYAGGDHSIFLGLVYRMQRSKDVGSLTFFDGTFHRLPVPNLAGETSGVERKGRS